MGEVVLFIEEVDTNMSRSFSNMTWEEKYRCRICHEEEEAERCFEAPCACSGTVKFAHRDCIQRWCDEKGNTTCEICLQEYKPGFTIAVKPCRLSETAVTIRDNGGRRNRRLVERADESDYPQCNSHAHKGVSCCRYLALVFSVVLLTKHGFDVVYGTDEYPFTIVTVLALKAIGILLPMLVIIRTIAAIQRSLRYQFFESEEDALSSEDDDGGLEEEQHLA